jgi:hypothetical protein
MVEGVHEPERALDAALLAEIVRQGAREVVLVEAALLAAVVGGESVAGESYNALQRRGGLRAQGELALQAELQEA